MNIGKTIFSQVMDYAPAHRFGTCVKRYNGDKHTRTLSCFDQFRCMVFAQLTYRESLRDTVTCLQAVGPMLYHMGIRSKIAKSTLADANRKRDWRICADFSKVLICRAKKLYADTPLPVNLDATVYALDSTIIDLCMNLFPWAEFRSTKSAVKLHTLLDIRGNIPEFIHISDGKLADMEALDYIPIRPGTFTVMDRGYVDFTRLNRFERAKAFYIVRARKNLKFRRRYSRPVDKSTGVQCDQTIVLTTYYPSKAYPQPLRRIRFFDQEHKRRFCFLTNNFDLPALTICELYRSRWRVELFFRWIKQHLRIKSFFGYEENALKTQIWAAVSAYLLVAIMRKELDLKQNMYEILQILSITALSKTPILQVFNECNALQTESDPCNQLAFIDF
jgi:transposase